MGTTNPSTLAVPVKDALTWPAGVFSNSRIELKSPNADGLAVNRNMLSLFGAITWSPNALTLAKYSPFTETEPVTLLMVTFWFVGFCTAKSTLIVGARKVPPGRKLRNTKFIFCPNEYRDKKYRAAAPPTNHSMLRIP